MDRPEFNFAVEQHQNMIYRIALHYFRNQQDAEDAVQETFLRLYLRDKGFESAEHLRRWLMQVTVNICKDTLKSPWRKHRVSMEALAEQPAFERPEQADLFREVMALPERYRTILNLYYYEELSTKEIAELLNLRQSAVTTRLSRGRERLKKRLGEAWNDDE